MNIKSFSYFDETLVAPSHIMMYVTEYEAYFHIWDIERNPVVKMNITGTTRQIRVTNDKIRNEIIESAKKEMGL